MDAIVEMTKDRLEALYCDGPPLTIEQMNELCTTIAQDVPSKNRDALIHGLAQVLHRRDREVNPPELFAEMLRHAIARRSRQVKELSE